MSKGEIVPDQYQFALGDTLSLEQELLLAFELRYKNELKTVGKKIQDLMGKELDFKTTIWNDECLIQLVSAARYYMHYFFVKNFYDALSGGPLQIIKSSVGKLSAPNQDLLTRMYRVFALNILLNEEAESFYVNLPSQEYVAFYSQRNTKYLQQLKDELNVLAMSSLEIVEAWDFHDSELVSALGRKDMKDDQQMYKEILDVVRKNPLNKNPVPKGFNRYMRP